MRPQLSSEVIKLTSTRTVYGLAAGAVAVVVLGTWSTISSAGAGQLSGELRAQPFFLLTSVNLAVFTLVLGLRSSTDEYRYGTVVPSVLASEHRGRLLVAKATVAGLAAALLAALAAAVMTGLAVLMSATSGGALQVSAVDRAALGGLLAASALLAAVGVGIGALVRHQVAAVVGGIVWMLVVENLGAGLLGDAGRYLPGQAAHGLAHLPDMLEVALAAAVLAGYAVAAVSAAHLVTRRRDL